MFKKTDRLRKDHGTLCTARMKGFVVIRSTVSSDAAVEDLKIGTNMAISKE